MKQSKCLLITVVLVFLFIVNSCKKDNTSIFVKEDSINSTLSFKTAEDCEFYTRLKRKLCIGYFAYPDDDVVYQTKITLTTIDDSLYNIIPFKSETGEVDFLIEDVSGRQFILSKTNDFYYRSFDTKTSVKSDLKVVHLLENFIQNNNFTVNDIVAQLNNQAIVTKQGDNLSIELTDSFQLSNDLFPSIPIDRCNY